MIVYKLVHKETRFGHNASIFIRRNGLSTFIDFLVIRPRLQKYFPRYFKDHEIDAVEGTMGLMCFWRYDEALHYLNPLRLRLSDFSTREIIQVDGIGYPSDTGELFGNCGGNPAELVRRYELDKDSSWYKPEYNAPDLKLPMGTVCFQKVRVLE